MGRKAGRSGEDFLEKVAADYEGYHEYNENRYIHGLNAVGLEMHHATPY
jgi:hypothetical protein